MDDVVDVVPEVVVLADMSGEAALRLLVESKSLEVAYVAFVVLVLVHEVLLLSELGEGVNDNTKEDVVEDNLDDQEERDVYDPANRVSLSVIVVNWFCVVTHSTA